MQFFGACPAFFDPQLLANPLLYYLFNLTIWPRLLILQPYLTVFLLFMELSFVTIVCNQCLTNIWGPWLCNAHQLQDTVACNRCIRLFSTVHAICFSAEAFHVFSFFFPPFVSHVLFMHFTGSFKGEVLFPFQKRKIITKQTMMMAQNIEDHCMH